MNQCACKMGWDKEKFWHIVYCPMHENADDMLEVLRVVLRRLECVEEPGHGLSIQESIKEIIAKAEGE